jgi:hypothetical protein
MAPNLNIQKNKHNKQLINNRLYSTITWSYNGQQSMEHIIYNNRPMLLLPRKN